MLNRLEAPAIKDAIDFDLQLKPYTKYTLDNGIEVYAIDAGEEEDLDLEACRTAGRGGEDGELQAKRQCFAGASGFIDLDGGVGAHVLVDEPVFGPGGVVLKGAIADQFTVEAAVVGEVNLFGHDAVEHGADAALDLMRVDGEREWLRHLGHDNCGRRTDKKSAAAYQLPAIASDHVSSLTACQIWRN